MDRVLLSPIPMRMEVKGQSLMLCILCQMLKINYAQIDKEALALVFTVQMFHTYLYGRKFVLVTNYKPLVTLLGLKKAIPPLAAARLQRWAISYQHILMRSSINQLNVMRMLTAYPAFP